MNKKLFFTLVLAGSFALSQPVYSATDAFTNAPGEAMYNSITNGTITPGADTCTIKVDNGAAGATVNWQNLNVPQNNALNFYFSNVGQYALNKVQSGVSRIAGSIGYAAGSEAGTVMIANPNGIICSGSSVINVGSLLLTTHDIIDTDGKNFTLYKKEGIDNEFHGISILPGATMNLDGNLTIASLGVDMNGANITAKNSVLVTSDGLNYVIADKSDVTKNTVANVEASTVAADNVYFDNNSDYGNYSTPVKVANTAFKTADGKIVITSTKSGEKIAINSSKFASDVDINSQGGVDITSSSKLAGYALADDTKGSFLGNVNINAKGNVNLSSKDANSVVPFSKDLTITTDGNIDMKNVRIMDDYSQKATLSGKNVTIRNYTLDTFDWNNNILGDVDINATGSIKTNQVQIAGNSVMKANNLIELSGTLLGQDSTYTADLEAKNITIKNSPINPPDTQGYYAQVMANLNAKASESISFINNGLIPALAHNAVLEAPEVNATDYAFKSLTINNFENFNTKNVSVAGDLTLKGKQNATGENITNVNLDKLVVDGNLTTNDINDVDLTNSHIKGDYVADNVNDLYMFNDIIDGNIIISNVNKLVQETVTGNDSMYLDNVNDWTMDNTHIKNGIYTTNIGSYTSPTGNNTANGLPYTFVQPSAFDADATLSAYVDTLNPGTALDANAGNGQFVARAFAADDEDDSDYKEEFLTRYVKEDKNGNLYTTNTFKAE